MSNHKILKWVSGGLEALLGIPVVGGLIVIALSYIPLLIMLVLHIVTFIFTKKENGSGAGSILGIVTSCIGWIPFVGMVMHILSAIFLMTEAAKADDPARRQAV